MSVVQCVGLDIAKNVFHVHGADRVGHVMVRRQLRRAELLRFFGNLPRCVIGMEACATAHHWARELEKLGHDCKLIPARYVKAYLKTNKNDLRDAEAICEAVQRPTMHFVTIKSVDQQAVLTLHRSRELLVAQRTQLGNSVRAQLAEFGLYLRVGSWTLTRQVAELFRSDYDRIPQMVRSLIEMLLEQWKQIQERITLLERQIERWHRSSEQSKRLAEIPGIGPITASAMMATVGDAKAFRSSRHFAAWLGLVPKQHSTGGRPKLGSISKRGDGYLRRLLVHGAQSVMRWHRAHPNDRRPWLDELLRRRPVNVAAVAVANKNARTIWALLVRGERFTGYRSSAAVLAC
jgi:transposase